MGPPEILFSKMAPHLLYFAPFGANTIFGAKFQSQAIDRNWKVQVKAVITLNRSTKFVF